MTEEGQDTVEDGHELSRLDLDGGNPHPAEAEGKSDGLQVGFLEGTYTVGVSEDELVGLECATGKGQLDGGGDECIGDSLKYIIVSVES